MTSAVSLARKGMMRKILITADGTYVLAHQQGLFNCPGRCIKFRNYRAPVPKRYTNFSVAGGIERTELM